MIALLSFLNQRKCDRKDQALDGRYQATQGHLAIRAANRRRGMPGQRIAHFFFDMRRPTKRLEGMPERVKHDGRIADAEPVRVAQVALKPFAEVRTTASIVVANQFREEPVVLSFFDQGGVAQQTGANQLSVDRDDAPRAFGLQLLPFAFVGDAQERTVLTIPTGTTARSWAISSSRAPVARAMPSGNHAAASPSSRRRVDTAT